MFGNQYHIHHNYAGFLFKKHRKVKHLEPGIYRFGKSYQVYSLPLMERTVTVVNQEVVTKDNIALRFSFFITYKISQAERTLDKLDLAWPDYLVGNLDNEITRLGQVSFRSIITGHGVDELNERRQELLEQARPAIQKGAAEWGVDIGAVEIRDISFPKNIQELFAKKLEARVRAEADLENARTQVAAARTLKNASELIQKDEGLRYLKWLETITRLGEKGKHTFQVGDYKDKL